MEEPKDRELTPAQNAQEMQDSAAQDEAKKAPGTPQNRDDMFRSFRCIVAAYLVYLGGDLGVSVMRGQTASVAPYLAAAILFAAAGVFFLIRDLPPLFKKIFSRRK